MSSTLRRRLLGRDYESRKWDTSGGLLVAPVFSRSLLSRSLASNFPNHPQRQKWLELSVGTTVTPSRVPPLGVARYDPPSSERKKAIHVQNKASYLRIKACPPDYILNPRYYKDTIERNRRFRYEAKSIQLSSDRQGTPSGESMRSFLLGARYSDSDNVPSSAKFKSSMSPKHDDLETLIPPPDSSASRSRTSTPGKVFASAQSQTRRESLAQAQKPRDGTSVPQITTITPGGTKQKVSITPRPTKFTKIVFKEEGKNTADSAKTPPKKPPIKKSPAKKTVKQTAKPLMTPIAIISSNSHTPCAQRPLIRSSGSPLGSHVELPLKPGMCACKPKDPIPRLEPRRTTSHLWTKPAAKQQKEITKGPEYLPEEREHYFISPEAQELAGKILEEAHQEEEGEKKGENEASGGKGDVRFEQMHQVPAEIATPIETPKAADFTSELPGAMSLTDMEGEDGREKSAESAANVAVVIADETNNMASKSSTIFVDMSNLNVQGEDS